MKKLLSLILAAASIFTMGAAVFAETEKTNSSTDATITFDTDKALDYVHTFGNASDTGLKTEISEKEVIWGRSLLMSEDFKGSLSNRYGGFYLDAADFGLANFGGYTVTFNIHATKEAAKATDRFEIFADGDQWSSTPFATSSNGTWVTASMIVPADSKNTKVGISIPITETFTGNVCYVDNIDITDNYGKTLANIGDIDTSVYTGPSGFTRVITTILFIVLIIAAVGGIAFFVLKVVRKFR